jgi:HEAT repeat protein
VRHYLLTGVTFLLALSAVGCSEARPTMAGGKPVNHWAAAIRDPDPKVRREAAAKLGNVGGADPLALPALVAALKDPDAAVRRAVIVALAKHGPAAREAVPALEELRQRDRDSQVRQYAGRALEKLKDEAPDGRR